MRSLRWLSALSIATASCAPVDAYSDAAFELEADGGADPGVLAWDAGEDLQEDTMWKRRDVQAAVLIALGAVAVTRISANEAPTNVNAGADASGRALVNSALSCSADDDGHKQALTYSWAPVGELATSCPLTNANTATATANCKAPGTYTFRCSAYDGEFTVTDDMVLTVDAPYPQDAVIAAGGSAPAAFLSYSYRPFSGYTGPAIRVRRSNDNAQADIGYASDGWVDTAAEATHCGANNCFAVTFYDGSVTGSSGGRDFTNASTAQQAKVYDSATGFWKIGSGPGLPVALTTTSNQYQRPDILGIATGATAVSTWTATQASATGDRVIMSLGGTGQCLQSGIRTSTIAMANQCFGITTTNREFTPSSAITSGFHSLQYSIPGLISNSLLNGTSTAKMSVRQNGSLLPQSALGYAGYSNLNGTSTEINAIGGGGANYAGSVAGYAWWGGAAAAAQQTVPAAQAMSVFGEMLRARSGNATSITYPVQSVAATVAGAYSCGERLSSTYAGPIITVAVDSGGTQYNVGANALGRLDLVALGSFCVGHDCYVTTIHDQSGNDRDIVPLGTAYKIWDASTGLYTLRDLPVCRAPSSGAAGYGRSDSIGLTGNPALSVYTFGRDSAAGTTRTAWSLGDGVGSISLRGFTNDDYGAAIGDATSYRRFANTAPQHPTHWLYSQAASGTVGASVLEQGLITVAEASVSGGSNTPNISGTSFVWGARVGSTAQPGDLGTIIVWSADLDGTQRTAIRAFGQRQKADGSGVNVAIGGQSNAANLTLSNSPYARNWTLPWERIALANTSLLLWEPPSDTLYVNLRDIILAADPRYPVIIWWIQGEADCGDGTLSSNYATKFLTMWTALKADTGRADLFLLDTLLDTTGTCTNLSTINTQKNTIHSTIGDRYSALLNPNSVGGALIVESPVVHWDPTKQAAMFPYARDTGLASYPGPN